MSTQLRRARNRQMLIFLLVCLGMVVMLGRLYYWQVLQSQNGYRLAQLANDEHIQNQIVDAPRGLIYDAQGHILATNVVRDDVYIEPIQFSIDHSENLQNDLTLEVNALQQVLPDLSEDKLRQAFSREVQTVRIAVRIDPEQSQTLRKMHLSDIFLEPRTWRVYPGGGLAAQILGYVTQDENNNRGYYGVEGQYNTALAGTPGTLTAETDLNGNPLVVGANAMQPAVNGADLTLTINSTIEYMLESGWVGCVWVVGAQGGAGIVINARTGAIIAMAGVPTFDPNQYGFYAGQNGCLGSEQVYFNPALYCAYEPGSTMKAVTMAAALDQGLITPDTTINDPGYLTFGGDAPIVRNWDYKSYGTETMTQVIEHSSNVGAAYVAYKILGPDRYYPYLARFGFGTKANIAGPESAGTYRVPGSQGWTPSDLTRQAFGQSILATPLQVAMAYQAIANGGVMMRPYIVASMNKNGRSVVTQPQVARQVISSATSQALTYMLTQSVLNGYAQSASVPGYSVAAKTGTATTQGLNEDQTEASVAGFIPASNPQFVILIKIDRPQQTIYGGTAAAPLWKSIAEQLMWQYQIPPDGQ